MKDILSTDSCSVLTIISGMGHIGAWLKLAVYSSHFAPRIALILIYYSTVNFLIRRERRIIVGGMLFLLTNVYYRSYRHVKQLCIS